MSNYCQVWRNSNSKLLPKKTSTTILYQSIVHVTQNSPMNKKNALLIFALLGVLLSSRLAAQPITLVNPILTGFYPDPSVVKVGTDYYLVHSTFSYFPGIPVFHSKDLKNWQQIGNVIDRPEQMDFMGERLTRGLFAPAISYHNGTYYVTCTDIDNDGNFVVTAKNPAGPWSKPVRLPQVRGIDPSLYFDDTGDAYILYNSDAPDNKPLYDGHRTIQMYAFDPVNLKVTGEKKMLVNWGVDISKKPVWIEAPHILKRNGWYYLYAAEGGTSVNHSEVVLRSKDVWGPYVPYENNPILTQRDLPADRKHPITSAGHAQFVDGPDGKTYAIFLAVRPYEGDYYNTGRETFIAPVEWKNDWPIINPDTKEIQYYYTANYPEVKLKGALPQAGNFAYTLTFENALDPTLLFMRTHDKSWYSLSKKAGLTLQLKPETIMEYGNPAFIGKRQQHLFSTAETELSFSAKAPNEKAGLVIFQDEQHFYYLCKSQAQGTPVIQLYKSHATEKSMELLAEAPLNAGTEKVGLRIASAGDTYSFSFSADAKNWKLLKDKVDARYLSSKKAGSFIGCLYGLYATSSGEPGSNSASFRHLKYQGNDPMFK
jgi:xylan 1,4-beta-xylosidase